ncbi:MAG: hypothetical protein AAF744_09665 [Pseudomonadota bacterium]
MFRFPKSAVLWLAIVAALSHAPKAAVAEHHVAHPQQGSVTIMGVRNDVTNQFEMRKVFLPRGFRAKPGECYMWYPGQMPALSWCDVVIPRGAILLLG